MEKALKQEFDKLKKTITYRVYLNKYQIDLSNLDTIDYSRSYESISAYIEKYFKTKIVIHNFKKKLKSSILISYKKLIRKIGR